MDEERKSFWEYLEESLQIVNAALALVVIVLVVMISLSYHGIIDLDAPAPTRGAHDPYGIGAGNVN